ncbi:MAG: hypothetical protein M1817_000885 [Caeruleum heppii]|nr:MAG: hypothetical protein M1817_000885 [Caeruleum heppii]
MTHQPDATRMLDDRGYSGTLIRGQNPALLLEKAVRDRITDSYFWKEQCFGLNEASLCDRAAEVGFVGGTFGPQQRPAPFLCLLFKMLQLGPGRDIVEAYLYNEDFKYLTALAAFYIRLTYSPQDVYKTLEPLLSDYRKLKRRTRTGFSLTYLDQFVDELLTKDRVCATSLWKLPSRQQLEDLELLDERISPLQEELESMDEEDEGERRSQAEDDEDIQDVTLERRNGDTGG